MRLSFFLCVLATAATTTSALSYSRSQQSGNDFAGDILVFKDRLYVPYGPDLTSTPIDDSQPWKGYAYGIGATEHWAYDYVEGYIYSQSEAGGYITVIDYQNVPGTVTEYSFDAGGQSVDIRDIAVCPQEGVLFLTVSDRSNVLMYSTVKRSEPTVPTLMEEIDAGNSPDALTLSNDCSILAVANQNEGTTLTSEGALTLVTGFLGGGQPITTTVRLNGFDDDYLLSRDVHLPLSQNGARYWAAQNPDLGWDQSPGLIDQWNSAIAFDPEYLAFNDDGSELYLNLQDNSALARIDTATGKVMSVYGYGLKDMTTGNGVDIIDDKECKLITSPCLYLHRTPDAIATVEYEGVDYILTAEEGSDFDLGDYEEKQETFDVFLADGTFSFPNFTFSAQVEACRDNFADGCEDNANTEWCSNLEITMGSSAVDYSDPTKPIMNRIVAFGGRGLGIFKLASDPTQPMTMVWDSASRYEQETCDKFPWAHNAVMDEEFAPVNGPLWILDEDAREDIEEKNDPLQDGCTFSDGSTGACAMEDMVDAKAQEDGLAVESVAVGVACDHLVAVGCGENNGVCLLWDISIIESPVLLKTFHLSPASRSKNPEQSYRQDLGDLDSETIKFVSPDTSPTGKAALIFAGAISGTLSFYEFQCQRDDEVSTPTFTGSETANASSTNDEKNRLSGGAITGIVIGSLVVVGLIVFVATKSMSSSKEMDTGKPEAPRETTESDGVA